MNARRLSLALRDWHAALPLAQAIEFSQVQPARAPSFVSKQMNVPVEGKFSRFSGKLAFDPAKPTAAKAAFEIDLASIDAGVEGRQRRSRRQGLVQHPRLPVAKFVLGPRSSRWAATASKCRQDDHQGQALRTSSPRSLSAPRATAPSSTAAWCSSVPTLRLAKACGPTSAPSPTRFRSGSAWWPPPQVKPPPPQENPHEKAHPARRRPSSAAVFRRRRWPSPKPTSSSRPHLSALRIQPPRLFQPAARFDKTSGKIVFDRVARTGSVDVEHRYPLGEYRPSATVQRAHPGRGFFDTAKYPDHQLQVDPGRFRWRQAGRGRRQR
jgi:hypothetical protein